ncbi:MAG: phosphoglycolate phosphatase [Candidatus Azotimanducaceae bacterium]|jgi:phosphoglycolate phosphatase
MPSLKALLFDLDGTLLDTLTSLANCFNRVLNAEGYPTHPVEAYRLFIGDGARQCVIRCLPDEEQDDITVNHVLRLQQADYLLSWQQDVEIYSGIATLLAELKTRGLPMAVLSNKDHAFVERCVGHFFKPDTFAAIQGYSASIPHKPDPAGAQQLIHQLGIPASETALIGDTAVDVETAITAGICSIGVLWGFRDREELEKAGAHYIVKTPEDVLGLF